MQNQACLNNLIEYDPIELPEDFPVSYPAADLMSPSAGQVSFMHYHNNTELGYCYKGCGLFFIDEKLVPFSAGDAIIIFQNQIHIAQSRESEPSYWKFINIDPLKMLANIDLDDFNMILDILKRNVHAKNLFSKEDRSGIGRMIYEIISELENRRKNYKSMVKALTWSIMAGMSRIDSSEYGPDSGPDRQNLLKIAPALKYISDNYMNPVTMDDLAARCSISTSQLRRLFGSAIGMAPSEYLYIVRIKMASILLLNLEESILEISIKVGYTTLSSFNRHFKSIMGVSPKMWRKKKTS